MITPYMRVGVNGMRTEGDSCLVGHEQLLAALSSELRILSGSSADVVRTFSKIYCLLGPKGIGKRTFVNRLWAALVQKETPRILFSIDPEQNEPLDEQIRNSSMASKPFLDWILEQLAAAIDEHARNYVESGRPLPMVGKVALWSALLQRRIVENPEIKSLQIIFVLHNFSRLPVMYRKILARAIPQGNGNVDIRIIATGSGDDTSTEIGNLFFDRSPLATIKLPFLGSKDVENWLYSKGLPLELTNEIHRRSEGLPGKLEAACEAVIAERGSTLLASIAEEVLRGVSSELRKYVCMAALLPEINSDTLRAIMPEIRAKEVLTTLKICEWTGTSRRDDSFRFGQRVGKALSSYLEGNHSPTYLQARDIADQLAPLCSAIPSYKDRKTLRSLLPFAYFNRSLLLEIIPNSAEWIFSFVVEKRDLYFEQSGENWRLRPGVRILLEKFAALTHHNPDGEIHARIQQSWTARKAIISERIASLEHSLNRDTHSFLSIKKRMEELLEQGETRLQRRLASAAKKQKGQGKHKLANLSIQAAGTFILYLCILSTSRGAILYALAGLFLIIWGLCREGASKASVGESISARSDTADLQNGSRLTESEIKALDELEAQKKFLLTRLTDEKRHMRNLVRQLDEPYSSAFSRHW